MSKLLLFYSSGTICRYYGTTGTGASRSFPAPASLLSLFRYFSVLLQDDDAHGALPLFFFPPCTMPCLVSPHSQHPTPSQHRWLIDTWNRWPPLEKYLAWLLERGFCPSLSRYYNDHCDSTSLAMCLASYLPNAQILLLDPCILFCVYETPLSRCPSFISTFPIHPRA